MSHSLAFAPLLPVPVIAVALALAAAMLIVAAVRRGRGWLARALALAALATALVDPRVTREDRAAEPDLAVVVVDRSASQAIGDRAAQAAAARVRLAGQLARFDDLEVRYVAADDARGDGTRLFAALEAALADEPRARLAGAVLITDGQVHDAPEAPASADPPIAAPVHVLLTGEAGERDRRVVVEQAPAYSVVGRPINLIYRIDDRRPTAAGADREPALVRFRIDGEPAGTADVAVGTPQVFTFAAEHAGPTVVEVEVAAAPGELSALNNRTVAVVNGVRDRLRVLLVSGQPHAGERTWRNLLKSDPSVDLVHFTILRPPEKDEMTPLRELSLIVFPVQELFQEKLYDFDLIVFDRYIVRDVLPSLYLRGIAQYVRDGGAVLLAVGPEFAGLRSLYRTPLGDVMPGVPTGRVLEGAFRPRVTEIGERHPVTSSMPGAVPSGAAGDEAGSGPAWGRWFRTVEAEVVAGSVLMSGYAGSPLVVVDRVGQGRVAQVMSDHVWLWARGYDGGGPHAELIRRLAHWLMKEPELEEERLSATVEDGRLLVERRSLATEAVEATVTAPDGRTETVTLAPGPDGVARAEVDAGRLGLYRVEDGAQTALAAAGTLNPVEFADLRATADRLAPIAEATGGGVAWIADGLPDFRRTRPGRDAAGRGWMGLVRNEVSVVTGVSEVSLLPFFGVLALVLGGLAAAWWREGR